MSTNYLDSATKTFSYYKHLGEKTFAQVPNEKLFWQLNETSNSIAVIVNHLSGNMLSRWTDFLTSDGEKPWRNRDAEFENQIENKQQLLERWDAGWERLFNALQTLTDDDLGKEIFIRNQGQTVVDAINRQLAHYAYHVGQIVYVGKIICDGTWTSLSIPKRSSERYNEEKFSQEKHTEHFTDEVLKKKIR